MNFVDEDEPSEVNPWIPRPALQIMKSVALRRAQVITAGFLALVCLAGCGPISNSALGSASPPVAVGSGGDAAPGQVPSTCGIGELILMAGSVAAGLPAHGQTLNVSDSPALFASIGSKYGGDGRTTFQVPDMRPFEPNGTTYSICDTSGTGATAHGCYVGQIRTWAGTDESGIDADGRSYQVAGNQWLYSQIGIQYGSSGQDSFNVPNLSSAPPLDGIHYTICDNGVSPNDGNGYTSAIPGLYTSELVLAANMRNVDAAGLAPAGTSLPQANNQGLEALIGTRFGGTSEQFEVPQLAAETPQLMHYYIVTGGEFPPRRS